MEIFIDTASASYGHGHMLTYHKPASVSAVIGNGLSHGVITGSIHACHTDVAIDYKFLAHGVLDTAVATVHVDHVMNAVSLTNMGNEYAFDANIPSVMDIQVHSLAFIDVNMQNRL